MASKGNCDTTRWCNSAPLHGLRSTLYPDEPKIYPHTGYTVAEEYRGRPHATIDQMRAEAALTIVRALGVRTVTGSELHGSLLMQTVCCASGVYRERSR